MKESKLYLKFSALSKIVFWDFYSLSNKNVIQSKFPIVPMKEVLTQRKEFITIDDSKVYKRCRAQVEAKGIILRDEIIGKEIKTKKQQVCKTDDFLVAEIDAKVGGFGIIPDYLEGAIVSGHYFSFKIDKKKLLPEYLGIVVKQNDFFKQVKATGSTNYAAIRPYHVLEYVIPLPTIAEQRHIINDYNEKIERARELEKEAEKLMKGIEKYLFEKLGLERITKSIKIKGLQLYTLSDITEWGLDKINTIGKNNKSDFKNYPVLKFAIDVFRGKSPVYKDESPSFILNQKCNRWNSLDVSFAKNVDDKWFSSINEDFFTREGDILINSTGEGTIGRATYIKSEYQGLLYDSHMLLLRIDNNIMNPELFVELFNSQFGQRQVNDLKSAQATKQTELGVGNLQRIVMPIPDSLEFQKEIVKKIKIDRNTIIELKLKAINNIELAQNEFNKEIFG